MSENIADILDGLLTILEEKAGGLIPRERRLKHQAKALAERLRSIEQWKQMGVVGVDSGQLMICDPCYLENEWEHSSQSSPHPGYRHTDGTRLACALHSRPSSPDDIMFDHYEQVIQQYGKTANQMLRDNDIMEIPRPAPSGWFSYTGCCEATLGEELGGQLNYRLGHPGAGVVAASGFGDGVYPVYVRYVDYPGGDRRIAEMKVIMLEDDES